MLNSESIDNMMDHNIDIICAYFAHLTISLADVKTEIQILSSLIFICYTLWRWNRDRKNDNKANNKQPK